MEHQGNEIKRYILTLVHIRKRLIKSGKSKKNKLDMEMNTDFLERHLLANNYTDKQMLQFFARHGSVIHSIIPGEESKCSTNFLKKFGEYYSLCQQQQK